MAYTTEQIAQALKAAREGKGLSQRALAKLTGVPQSHISKIETGGVDLRLSSLVEIARALDLEVTLVPRKNLSVVQSIIRSTERPAPQGVPGPSPARELRKLQASVRSALTQYPSIKELAQMQSRARDLQRLVASHHADINALREATKTVQTFRDTAAHIEKLRRSIADMQHLRNIAAHDVPRAGDVKPAYSLEEDEHG